MVCRNYTLGKLLKLKDKRIIKVFVGIRRCGKSTVMEQFRDVLLKDGVAREQITFMNFEDAEFSAIKKSDDLFSAVNARLVPEKMNYVFLDEVQNIENFQKALDFLFVKKNVDLYVTGSNAFLLSGELATLLSGRYVEMRMLPLSFSEFKELKNEVEGAYLSNEDLYRDFITFGSLPYTVYLNRDREIIHDYLGGVYSSVILKDVLQKNKTLNANTLERILKFLMDSTGSEISMRNVANALTSAGFKISAPTVLDYVTALENCFIVYKCPRFDIKGKQFLQTLEKYYTVDLGIKNYLLGFKQGDMGHNFENVIYFELLFRGYKVATGKIDATEIDFVATKENETLYIQVALTVRDEETLQRELLPLKKIRDNYEKILLTLDNDPPTDHNGIKQIYALDFLKGWRIENE